MGTEVLRPQDCLVRHSPVFRRPNPTPNCSPRSNPNPSARSWRRAATYGARRRWEGSAKRGVGGAGRPQQVAAAGRDGILKRGGDDAAKKAEGWEAAVFGAGRLGPDPHAIPKGLRLRAAAAEEGGDAYAGSAFAASPSPRALPLPRFPRRSAAAAAAAEEEATRGLRRLLRLE